MDKNSPIEFTGCPRCGNTTTSAIVIGGMSYSGCARCHLPVGYFGAYKKEYQTTPSCPFCDGLGEMNYAESKDQPYSWGPCLYCRKDDYEDWIVRSD